MATVVTVHGTFAHVENEPSLPHDGPVGERAWWQSGSGFEQDVRELVDADPSLGSGKIEFKPYVWSGANSEVERRKAGKQLFNELKALEAKQEPYCVVAHSHGGSVMSWALLESAARNEPLDGLKRWITVGTPFVSLKKEPLLFQRLDLLRKVIFVASMMLLVMFLVYATTELLFGGRRLIGATFPTVLAVTGIMMSLPIIFFYSVLKYLDGRGLLHYRRRVRARANDGFAQRWLSLTHTDDEAVQGLAFLPGAKLAFFDKSFAVPAITMLSVLGVPLLYFVVLSSPTIMVGLGNWLKSSVYETASSPDAEKAVRATREQFRAMRREMRTGEVAPEDRRAAWSKYRELRATLEERYPELPAAERSLRFKQRFFEADGNPCDGGNLCGAGRDLRINSGLLLHIVTDELSSLLGGEEIEDRRQRWLLRLVIPAIIVPVVFGLLSLLLMLVIRSLAKLLSAGASHALNSMTNAEVKRAAFGNDTEGEIAVGAVDRPTWIERSPPRLPPDLSDIVTDYSNGIANQSLAKFRKAIGQLASAEPKHTADSAITTYFTWKELVHASYFDVPEFRKLVAQAISRVDGFAPSTTFQSDPDFSRTAQWLTEILGPPGSFGHPLPAQPTPEDASAVSAVVASTIKQEP